MKLTINNYPVEVYEGATIGDAVRVWAVESEEQLYAHRYTICDELGFEISPDGPAREGMRLTLTKEVAR